MVYAVQRLGSADIPLMHQLLDVFGEVFDERAVYGDARPDPTYLANLLGEDTFIAMVALGNGRVVGGLAAYVLRKFEQPRSEVYIYDLAVAAAHRRRGLATRLIQTLLEQARDLGAWAVFVQADQGDDPAIALYSRLGAREDVLHFDIRLV